MDTNKPAADLRVLRGKSGEIFRAIMNTIIPRGGAYGPGAADYDLLPRADEILRSYDPAVRKLFPLILLYVQYGAIFRKGRTFTGLSERKGMEFLGSMERSPFFYRRMTILAAQAAYHACFLRKRRDGAPYRVRARMVPPEKGTAVMIQTYKDYSGDINEILRRLRHRQRSRRRCRRKGACRDRASRSSFSRREGTTRSTTGTGSRQRASGTCTGTAAPPAPWAAPSSPSRWAGASAAPAP